MRLKSNIWVSAYLRRCQGEGVTAVLRRRGAEEAGAIFIKLSLLDGNAILFAPASQTAYDESRPADRLWRQLSPRPVPDATVEDKLKRESGFDPDIWIIEIEDRGGRHFLDLASA